MTNDERIPKPEDPMDRRLARTHRFGFRDSGFIRHSPFVIPHSLCLLLLLCNGCAHMPSKPAVGAEQQVHEVLEAQVRAWNAGDLRRFMEGYARSDRTRFQSGGDVSLGWQTVFDRYQRRYRDRASMGVLKFREVEVTVLDPKSALAVGRWRLERAQDAPSGLFTLLFRRTSTGWRIVHDHTSAAATATTTAADGGSK
jgi:ketosteroid isomerase-like protein